MTKQIELLTRTLRGLVLSVALLATPAVDCFGQSTNAPPYTVPINGTNFIIDWVALGATNTVIITNYANAGIMHTNISYGIKSLTMLVQQGGQGFCNLVPNGLPNQRTTAVQTQITQSTNGNYWDIIIWKPITTNAVLSGQNWGAAP